jgi:peptidoglycan/LPS O-acetylase OafA/YrhL
MDRPREASGGGVVQAGERRSARVESLRALAALGVLVSHCILAGGGFYHRLPRTLAFGGSLGVFLFFALTGYLLFLPFARRASGDSRPIDLRRYALNRAVRVLPLYYVVLVVLLLVNEHGGTPTQWWRFATFSQSFFANTVSTVDGPMWSLVVEIEFYALLPLIAWGIARVARQSRLAAAGFVVALGLASAAVWWVKVGSVGGSDLRWKYSLPATFFNFTPGMLLALLRLELLKRPRARLPSSTVLLVLGGAVWVAAATQLTYPQPLAAAGAFLVVGAVVLPVPDGPLARLLDARGLVTIGIASYSLYLWHHPIVLSLGAHLGGGPVAIVLAGVALCVPIALASYALVERPFLRLRRRWGPTAASPAGVDAGAALAPLEAGRGTA